MPDLYRPFITGQRCYLRGLEEADLTERYLEWLNDAEVTRALEVGRRPATLDDLYAFWRATTTDATQVVLAVCDRATNLHIGNVKLAHIHPVHRRADFSIMIGDKAYWGGGYGSEATRLMVDYGFRRLNLHSIYLGVLANHGAARRVYEKNGFRLDGTDRQAWWADGTWHDVHRMSILAAEYAALTAQTVPTKESTE
ncbi:MAG: GNAT family N-acetyltransferase [Anaerolineales bacterium]